MWCPFPCCSSGGGPLVPIRQDSWPSTHRTPQGLSPRLPAGLQETRFWVHPCRSLAPGSEKVKHRCGQSESSGRAWPWTPWTGMHTHLSQTLETESLIPCSVLSPRVILDPAQSSSSPRHPRQGHGRARACLLSGCAACYRLLSARPTRCVFKICPDFLS